MSTNLNRHSIINAAIGAAVVAVIVVAVSLGGLWVLRVGLDRDNAYEEAKESAYWEMRAGVEVGE